MLIFQGVCQPISKIFCDPLPVWGNPNLIINQCSWCISSWVDANYEHSEHSWSPSAIAPHNGGQRLLELVSTKGQLISKANCQAVNSSKKRTNEFVFTTMRHVFVRFLEEIEDTKKTF